MKKSTVAKYEWAAKYILSELSGGRDIASSLGSAGFTFITDISDFTDWCRDNGYEKLADLVQGRP